MHRKLKSLTLLLTVGLAIPSLAAPPPIAEVFAERDTDHLRIWWKPPSGVFDGYRIYKSDDVSCTPDTLVYEGTATSWTDIGALVDPTLALYRVQTYTSTESGDFTLPIYRYELVIKTDTGTGVGGRVVSLPWFAQDAPPPHHNANDECTELNGAPGVNEPILSVTIWDPPTSTLRTKFCHVPFRVFDMEPQRAYNITAGVPGDPAVIVFGLSQPGWQIDLPLPVVVDPGPPAWYLNLLWVAFPYDHDYVDLADVALDIPEALVVHVWDNASDNLYGEGLSRLDTGSPWVGTNYTLDDRRGDGLIIGVETPTSWVPRRLCIGSKSSVAPGRVNPLMAVKAGGDVDLEWPPDSLAEGGYDVWRVSFKGDIPTVLGLPIDIDVPAPSPTFPVTDLGAVGLPSIHYYQVVGRALDDTPGAL